MRHKHVDAAHILVIRPAFDAAQIQIQAGGGERFAQCARFAVHVRNGRSVFFRGFPLRQIDAVYAGIVLRSHRTHQVALRGEMVGYKFLAVLVPDEKHSRLMAEIRNATEKVFRVHTGDDVVKISLQG